MRDFQHRNPVLFVLRIVGMTIGGIFLAVLMAFLFGWIVMLLWNALMPAIFHLGTINFWQAAGLVVLARLLVGGLGGKGHGGGQGRRHGKHKRYAKPWKHIDWGNPGEWKVGGNWKNWKYYKQYWREEGKAQYERYLEKQGVHPGRKEWKNWKMYRQYWVDEGKAAYENYLAQKGLNDTKDEKGDQDC